MRIWSVFCVACFVLSTGCVGERTTTALDTSSSTTEPDATMDTGEDTSEADRRCLLQNGEGLLTEGDGPKVCELTECYAGWGDCDENGTNGCEANVTGAVNNCGACGVACGAGESCVDGACTCGDGDVGEGGAACTDGNVCCQGACVGGDDPRCACGDQAGGCGTGEACCDDACVTVLESNSHCGACGNPCGTNTACTGGSCVCNEGFADCDSNPENGCETSTNEATNCGACGNTCGAGELCVDGVCGCGTGAACGSGEVCCGDACVSPTDPSCSCGGQASCADSELCCADSCTAVLSDTANCGACGRGCEGAEVCQNGSCACPADKPNECGSGACVNFLTDTANCGGCGNACGAGESCCGGTCVDTASSNLHCGACFAGGGKRCTGATACCDGTCADLTDDQTCGSCNNNCLANGAACCGAACFDLSRDAANCGSCGNNCGASALCSGGGCVCEEGYGNCNNDSGDGCESDLMASDQHCGGCGNPCGADEACNAGKCECATFRVTGGGPKPNANSVNPTRTITLNMSCDVNPATANPENIFVYSSLNGFRQMNWSASGNSITSQGNLEPFPGERFFVVLTERVESVNGVSATPYSFEFRITTAGSLNFSQNNFDGIQGTRPPPNYQAVAAAQFDSGNLMEAIAANDEGDVCLWDNCACTRVLESRDCFRLPAGGFARAIATADFSKNGWVDAVFAVAGDGDSAVGFNEGGSELNMSIQSLNIKSEFEDVMAADFDNDGDIDIFFVNGTGADVFLLNDGRGGFVDSKMPLSNSRGLSGAYGDFNADGVIDVAVGTSTGVEIWLNDLKNGFKLESTHVTTSEIAALDVGDLDNNGALNLVAVLTDKREAVVLINPGDAKFSEGGRVESCEIDVALGDLSGDGELDMVCADPNDITVLLNDGVAKFNIYETLEGDDVVDIWLGDVSRFDGDLDIIIVNNGDESQVIRAQ